MQNIINHSKDMTHLHVLEDRLKPEMIVKTSALWEKRTVKF